LNFNPDLLKLYALLRAVAMMPTVAPAATHRGGFGILLRRGSHELRRPTSDPVEAFYPPKKRLRMLPSGLWMLKIALPARRIVVKIAKGRAHVAGAKRES